MENKESKNYRKRNIRLSIFALIEIILIATFFITYSISMNKQNLQQSNEVASTYVNGVSRQIVNHFKTITTIRKDEGMQIIDSIKNLDNKEDIKNEIINKVASYDYTFAGFYDEFGNVEKIIGADITSIYSNEYFIENIKNNNIPISYADGDFMQIVYGFPYQIEMSNGNVSIALLLCREYEKFASYMSLNNEGGLVYSSIILDNGDYILSNEDNNETNYFTKIEKYVNPFDSTKEELINNIKNAIASGESYTYNQQYINGDINQKRSVKLSPLPDSKWYLVTVMPYGALDLMVNNIARQRTINTIIRLLIFVLTIVIFVVYFIIQSRNQIKELRLSNEEKEEARKQAEKSNKAKSEFLSNMSHDIRTPMNAIVGMTTIAQAHIDDKEQVERCLEKITYSSKQLLGLINDILDMSKIESGKMVMHIELVSLKDIVKTICNIIKPQVDIKKQNFDIYIKNIYYENLYCDSIRVNQVLLNLLSNALKFTPEGGNIEFHLFQELLEDNKKVRTNFIVKDNGIGMSDEFIQKVFNAFEREDNKRVHKTEGSGLGLAITKYIVDALGGTIEVDSKPNEGTTFTVSLDLEVEKTTSEEMNLPNLNVLVVDDNEDVCKQISLSLKEIGINPAYATNEKDAISLLEKKDEEFFMCIIDYKLKESSGIELSKEIRKILGLNIPIILISAYDYTNFIDDAKMAGVNGFLEKPLFKSNLYYEIKKYIDNDEPEEFNIENSIDYDILKTKHILIAEDHAINVEILKTILEEKGMIVDVANDGKQCLEMFEKSDLNYYDAILMDLRMPKMDGYEATKAIKALNRDDNDIAIIAMTADAFVEDIQKCLDAGMIAHLSKPIDSLDLYKTLIKVINK